MTDVIHHSRSTTTVVPVVAPLVLIAPAWARWPVISVAVVGTVGVVGLAAAVDRRERRIPDRLLLVALVPLAVVLAAGLVVGGLRPVAPMLLGAAALGVPLLAVHLVHPAAMGFGDVKAGGVLGGALGLVHPTLALAALAVASAVGVGVGHVTGAREVAFGPALVAGSVVALAAGVVVGVEAQAWR